MLAVRGPRGDGLPQAQIIATFERRLENHPDFELARVRCATSTASPRSASTTSFGHEPMLGNQAWDCAELLAQHTDPGYAEHGQLTVTYLTDAHRACAAQLARWMHESAASTRSRSTRSATSSASITAATARRQAPAHRLALRHRAQRRQVRRPARHLRADGLRARAAPRRPAPALRLRGRRLRRGGRPALQGDLPRLGRADRPVRSAPGSTSKTPTASRCARRCSTPACRPRRRRSPRCSATRRLPRLRRGAHRAGAGAQPSSDLPLGVVTSINGGVRFAGEVRRHGQPRRHHADGPRGATPRPRSPSSRLLPREARRASEPNLVGTDGHARGAERLDQRRARPLPASASTSAPPPTPVRDALRRRRARRAAGDLRAARRCSYTHRGNDARRRRAERARLAAALGARGRRRSACRCTACPAAPATTR